MKKILLIAIAVFFVSSAASAQQKAFQFGFKIGPSISWMKMHAKTYTNEGAKIGFNWGFVGDFYLMENYSIQTGFNVMYLNGSYSYPDRKNTTDLGFVEGNTLRNLRLKYIQIPAVLRMRTNEINKFTYYGEAGLGLAFKTGAKADDTFTSALTNMEIEDEDVSKQYRFTRESLILGAGVYYNLGGSTRLFGGIRFDNNFFDIMKDQNSITPSIEKKGIANFIELNLGILL